MKLKAEFSISNILPAFTPYPNINIARLSLSVDTEETAVQLGVDELASGD
jgi:hypothetical protein